MQTPPIAAEILSGLNSCLVRESIQKDWSGKRDRLMERMWKLISIGEAPANITKTSESFV
ncbi:hypothetical protein CH359_12375 [Leptospira meyeri]|nr:hypothetical protein CH359_12375 [Leptospira meyeri]PJZ95681.1 hypothetical protein CH358_15080 [Leptospira meyeri]PKA13503.1 hypothetical protein CH372_04055 [Leptospira meyeri]